MRTLTIFLLVFFLASALCIGQEPPPPLFPDGRHGVGFVDQGCVSGGQCAFRFGKIVNVGSELRIYITTNPAKVPYRLGFKTESVLDRTSVFTFTSMTIVDPTLKKPMIWKSFGNGELGVILQPGQTVIVQLLALSICDVPLAPGLWSCRVLPGEKEILLRIEILAETENLRQVTIPFVVSITPPFVTPENMSSGGEITVTTHLHPDLPKDPEEN